MTCSSPYSLFETFYESVSDWCGENEVQYEEETVTFYSLGLTEENFETRVTLCGEALRTLNYNPYL